MFAIAHKFLLLLHACCSDDCYETSVHVEGTVNTCPGFLYCRAGSSANNLALLNFEYLAIYLSMCIRFGFHCPRPHAFNMQPHGCMMGESSADRNQRLARLRAQRQSSDSRRHSQRLASQRECEPRRHEQASSDTTVHITAAITACIIMAIPANRLAAMRESDERITSIFTPFLRGPLHFTYALVWS